MKQFLAFTTRFGNKVNVLRTPIGISLPTNEIEKESFPKLINTTAIWDTGASSSVITNALAKKMGLVPTGKMLVTNTTGKTVQNTYLINIYLPSKVIIPFLQVTGCNDVLGNNDGMLIGMDVIGSGDFSVTSENGKTVMSYVIPNMDTIDFVKSSNLKNASMLKYQKIDDEKKAREKNRLSSKTKKKKIRKKKRK